MILDSGLLFWDTLYIVSGGALSFTHLLVGRVAQRLWCRYLAGGLSLIYALSMVDMRLLCW